MHDIFQKVSNVSERVGIQNNNHNKIQRTCFKKGYTDKQSVSINWSTIVQLSTHFSPCIMPVRYSSLHNLVKTNIEGEQNFIHTGSSPLLDLVYQYSSAVRYCFQTLCCLARRRHSDEYVVACLYWLFLSCFDKIRWYKKEQPLLRTTSIFQLYGPNL